MAEIARLSGVSKPVVYTVLNHREGSGIHVSEKTAAKILGISKELGYVAPKSAKDLFSGYSDTIGVLIQTLSAQAAALLEFLQQKAFESGQDIIPYITMGDPELEEKYLEMCRDGRVDGIIIISATQGSIDRYRRFQAHPNNLKLLFVDGIYEGLSCVQHDRAQAAELSVRHFYDSGCRKIAYAGIYESSEQEGEYVKAVSAMGLKPISVVEGDLGAPVSARSHRIAERILKEKPDAVLASNDFLALCIVSKGRDMGIKVPAELSVIGIGGIEASEYSTPRLSTLKVDFGAMADAAFSIITQMIKKNMQEPEQKLIPCELLLRETTRKVQGK